MEGRGFPNLERALEVSGTTLFQRQKLGDVKAEGSDTSTPLLDLLLQRAPAGPHGAEGLSPISGFRAIILTGLEPREYLV